MINGRKEIRSVSYTHLDVYKRQVLNQGKAYSLYTWEGVCFAAASFVVMSVITAVIIAVTKKFWLLDFLLYGKWKKGALKKRADR